MKGLSNFKMVFDHNVTSKSTLNIKILIIVVEQKEKIITPLMEHISFIACKCVFSFLKMYVTESYTPPVSSSISKNLIKAFSF